MEKDEVNVEVSCRRDNYKSSINLSIQFTCRIYNNELALCWIMLERSDDRIAESPRYFFGVIA